MRVARSTRKWLTDGPEAMSVIDRAGHDERAMSLNAQDGIGVSTAAAEDKGVHLDSIGVDQSNYRRMLARFPAAGIPSNLRAVAKSALGTAWRNAWVESSKAPQGAVLDKDR